MSRLSDLLVGNTANREMMLPSSVDTTADTDWWGKVAADAIAAGAGQSLQTAMHGMQDLTGNPDWGKAAENWGAELANEHQQYYEPGSARYYASAGLQSLPEMAADLGISLGVSALGTPLAGAAKAAASTYKWANRAKNIYNGVRGASGTKGWLARTFLPGSPQALLGGATSTALEASMEGQRAMDDYIEEAKRNGTYVPGVTEEEGRNLRNNVFRDNVGLLALTNAAEFNSLFKKSKGLKAGFGRLGTHMASEGLEEAAQQIIPKAEQGKPWSLTDRDVLEAAGIGAVMGGAMHGIGRGVKAAFPNAFGDDTGDMPTNPMTDPNRDAKRDSDVPIPGDIDYTEADPSEVVNDWLSKQDDFNGFDTDTDTDTEQAQSTQGSSLPAGREVSGDNSLDGFDSNLISKWESKPGATELASVQPKVKAAFNALAAEYGDKITITGGAEKGVHAAGENGHEGGWKLDVDKSSIKDVDKFLSLCKRYGFAVGDEGDHFDLSANPNGGVGGTQLVKPDTFISDGGQVSPATASEGKAEGHGNAWAIANVFRNAGYNDEAIAGILGRVQQEHNFDTSDVPEHEEEGMHVGGYGMFQWNGGRTTAFLNWAKDSGKDPQNPTVQAEYALKEAQERGLTPDKMNKLSAEEAADLWTDEWEVGKRGSERQFANEWLQRIKSGGGSISTQDFGKLMGNHMIDFAGSEDDNLTNAYQRIMDGLNADDKPLFGNMFNADGTFNNTPENRMAIAQNEQTAAIVRAAAEQFAPQLAAPITDNKGRISKQAVKDYFTPQIAGVNMHALKDAADNDRLTDAQKVAVLQEAGNQLNVPRTMKSDIEQAKFVNDLQSAIDKRDFSAIHRLMPNETARAIGKLAQTAQDEPMPKPMTKPAAPIVTPEMLQPNMAEQQSQSTSSDAETVEPPTQNQPQNAPQAPQSAPEPQPLPSVSAEQENAQAANVQPKDFNTRTAELNAMPLGQLEQLGAHTLAQMQHAGMPVDVDLENNLKAGTPNAIAYAEKKLAKATANADAVYNATQNEVQAAINQYHDDAIPYDEANNRVVSAIQKAVAGNQNAEERYKEMFYHAIDSLDELYAKKAPQTSQNAAGTVETTTQKEIPSQETKPSQTSDNAVKNESPQKKLARLKKERAQDIADEVERMNRNPGGKGVNTVYTKNDRGEINGRYPESLNPLWYQKAYKKLRREPKKSEYPALAEESLKEHQEFDERDKEIARLEKEIAEKKAAKKKDAKKESAKNEPSSQNEEQENRFGDIDENFADLAKSLGITPAEKTKTAKANTESKKGKRKKRDMGMSDTSKEREEALKKQLSEALEKSRNRLNAMPFFDPDVIVPAFNLGRLYIQRGAETFADYARDMIDAVGDSVRSWLRPVWEMCENYPEGKDYDESQVIPMFRYVGSYMNDHKQATLDEVKSDFAKRAGKDNADKFSDLLELGYRGAYKWYNDNKEVSDNELNDSTREDSERNREGDNQDEVGAVHGNGESDSRRGQGVQSAGKDSRSQRGGSVHGRSTARSGEAGDSGVQGNESGRGHRNDSTGSEQLTGSRRDSFDRQAVDDGRNAESLRSSENRPIDGRNRGDKTETVKPNNKNFKAGDKAQIASSMPFLMPEQVDDVVKADTRLFINNGEGMMFTNGTGTGKTFTGLGVVSRMVQQGKKNILIVAPSDKVQNDWITAGKGFFGLDISKLENTQSAGNGIVITSYENVGANDSLVKRDWDMVVTDESHKLMQSEQGDRTHALENIRAMTYHHGGLRERFERLHAKEYERLRELAGKTKDHRLTDAEKKEYTDLNAKLMKESEKAIAEWQQIPQESKPKVLFLSATPFSYVPDIDYAEGYLFDYDRKKDNNGGYNQPNAYGDFLIKHFGYRMRTGKLTKPDADVNNDLMEIQFNTWLKNQGVLSGRKLKVAPDYERGYLLVDSGIGKAIDEGMKIATERGTDSNKLKYGKLHSIFENKLKGNKTRYLLEAIKAKEAVNLIEDYIKAGKKVVVFHDFKKNEAENPFVLTDEDFEGMDEMDKATAQQEYSRFCKEHPELLNLNLDDLQSPIERLSAEFGDSLRIFNGSVPKKKREEAVRDFNDDNSKVKVILCQRASAKEGISMHDTTGKHQRVMIDLGLATRPTDLIQGEGRIYRTGVKSNAIIRYLNTGTDMEKRAFASTIAGRASTAENLSMGEDARALRQAIVDGFMESLDGDTWKKYLPNSKTEGTGGKERDSKLMDGVSPYEAAKSDYFANQKKNSRNKAQEGIDYFPTPEPIGFKMVEWLGLKPGDRVLEPSAGHGAISRYFGADTRNTVVEPSGELATLAKMRLAGGTTSKVIEDTFENLDIHNKYEGIAMNPPYGVGGKTAYDHVAKAFDHLADGGRMIAIVPDGPAANKRLEKWLYGDGTKENPGQPNAALLAEIKLPQVAFKRAGTSVATKILVIDKYADADDMAKAVANAKGTIDFTSVKDINELFDRLENMTFSERVGSDIPRRFVNSTNKRGGSYSSITLPDDVELLNNDRLRQLAGNFKGYTNRKGGWFEFRNDNDRAKFVKAANKYLAGRDALADEQAVIADEVATPKTEHFEAGDFEHTKTGKMIPQAKIKDKVDSKVYEKLKGIAKRNGGYYNRFGKAFFFEDNETGRNQFLKEAEAFMSDKGSFSTASGKAMSTDELNELWDTTAEVVTDDKLTAREKEMQDVAKSMGASLAFVTCDPRIQGKYDPATGVSYINRDAAANSTSWIVWHEMLHWMKANNKSLFDKMVEHIKGAAPFTKEQLDKYRESIGRTDIDDDTAIEEMMADAFPEVRKRVPFFRDLAKENVSLYKRVVAFVKHVIDNIVSRFHAGYTKGNGLTVRQASLMHNAFCDMVRDLKDADGRPIFKVQNDGYREFTDMDGNTSEQILDAHGFVGEENFAGARYSLDNSETLTDNEAEALEKINDDMTFADAREVLLRDRNTALAAAYKVYEQTSGSRKAAKQIALDNLRGVYDSAVRKRQEYTTTGNLRNLGRLLRGQGKLREGSNLAETLQRAIDAGASKDVSAEVTQIPGEYRRMYAKIEKILGIKKSYSIAKHSNSRGAFSVAPENEPAGSMKRIKNATKKLLGLQEDLETNVKDRHTEKMNRKTSLDDTLPLASMLHSTRYLATKNEAIKRMYYLAERASKEQEHLRNEYTEVVKKVNKLTKDNADRESLQALLWAGDAASEEYTAEQLEKEGFSDNVIAAYRLIRDNLAKAYQQINEARLQVKVRNKTIKASELPNFMKENFITDADVINTQNAGNGNIIVTYRGGKVYSGLSEIINDDGLKAFENDDNIVITDKKKLGNGFYKVTYNEQPKPLGKLKGYMPHFFHRFMVYAVVKDDNGEDMRVAIGSAESLVDATKMANEVAKNNPDKEFVIDTHSFEYGDENNNVVIGDRDYQQMTKLLAKNTEMNLAEANKYLHDNAGASLKSRHRFFGNMMKRTGVQGFDNNMSWALTHYFNSAARYVAMEHFKPDAISWYERFFGDFNADPNTITSKNKRKTARFVRDYINDVNGNPREVEKWCNAVVDRIPVLGKKLNDTYNGRPALALSSKVSWFNAVTKLGCLSVSSPMLNFMQFINVATMLNSYKYAKMGLNKALKPSELDKLILDRSGIMDEINLSSDAGGYTQTRDYGGVKKGWAAIEKGLNKSMFFFTWCDALMRKSAILGAYYQGVQEKGMKPDKGQTISAAALDYAKEVNAESNFDYSAANTPEAIRMGSVITQQAFQFQNYPIMQFEFFWNHVVHGTNSQRAKFLAPYFLLTGLPGMVPFGELLMAFINALCPGDDDLEKKIKAELMRWAGDDKSKQALVNSVTNGVLAATTGIDISERAGMQNFFAGRYYGDKPESTAGALATLFGGAAVSTVSGVANQIKNGNPVEAIKAISPGLGNIVQAYMGETHTTHHRIGSTYDGMYERILHGMGFRHIDETNTQFINSYLYESKQRQREDKKYVMDAYLDNPSADNLDEIKALGISDKELKKYKESREKSSYDRAVGNEKKSLKKPKTEAQVKDDELRKFVKK